ncbi:hypothetical protein [Massilia sp. CF038]|uniref:hypothetical protein n=1 Tax=Massilia sp. CF038 TaxID=1881045 RepID=UPI00091D8E0A|nr:hypothetical protein [Massilia sp. CF038]SHG36469.1 hypothetical protein SAMN05428948_0095 [Massilia sp. CF038]
MKALLLLVLSLSHGAVLADAFRGQRNAPVYSADKTVKVVAASSGGSRAIKRGKVLWSIKEQVRYGYVSDDGHYFAALYDGANLIPQNPPNDLVLARFFRDGRQIKAVQLPEVIQSKSQLELTASHAYWGDALGFTAPATFTLRRVDRKLFHFDLRRYE